MIEDYSQIQQICNAYIFDRRIAVERREQVILVYLSRLIWHRLEASLRGNLRRGFISLAATDSRYRKV